MKVLISGFDPFGQDEVNPSIEAVKLLPDTIGDIEVIKVELPTVAYKCVAKMKEQIALHQPDVIINVGQAAGRDKISIERVALNVNDFRIPDNANQTYVDEAIYEDGENAYFASLPIKHIYETLITKGYRAEVSNSAGTFVCNHIMYAMLYYLNKEEIACKSGFVHIPLLPQQALSTNLPSMELAQIVEALELIIIASFQEEVKKEAGKEW